jgi:hypothetical protein
MVRRVELLSQARLNDMLIVVWDPATCFEALWQGTEAVGSEILLLAVNPLSATCPTRKGAGYSEATV